MDDRTNKPSIGVGGASDNTGNLGVTALFYSTLYTLERRAPGARYRVFDSGIGAPNGVVEFPDSTVEFERVAAKRTRRFHRPESFDNMLWSIRVRRTTAPIAALRSCDAVLDITGGDSYSDIYGGRRFRGARLSKEVVLPRV